MPTGYTADVGDGTVTDFRTFALRCARNFGATIMQRESPADEMPQHREPSTHSMQALAKAEARLAELATFTAEQAQAEAEREYAADVAREAEYAENRRVTRERYEAMLRKVERWIAPTARHHALKNFMREQLTESIRFDCIEYAHVYPPRDGKKWLDTAFEKAHKDVKYHGCEVAAEKARCATSNAWIDALYASLPVAK